MITWDVIRIARFVPIVCVIIKGRQQLNQGRFRDKFLLITFG